MCESLGKGEQWERDKMAASRAAAGFGDTLGPWSLPLSFRPGNKGVGGKYDSGSLAWLFLDLRRDPSASFESPGSRSFAAPSSPLEVHPFSY